MKRRLLAGVLTFVMMLSLLPTVAWAREGDGDESSASTTLRMKEGEIRTVSFDSGMVDHSSDSVSASNAFVTVSSTFEVADAPVTDAKVPEGYYYIRGTRKGENGYWSDGNLTESGWGDKTGFQWLTYTDQSNAAIYQVIDNGDDTYALKIIRTASGDSANANKYLSSKYGELTEAVITNYGDSGKAASFFVASMGLSDDIANSKFTITPANASTTTGHYQLSAGNDVYVNSLGGYERALFYQTSGNNEGSIMDFYKVGYTTTVTVTANSVGKDKIKVGDRTIEIVVSDDNSFKDVYVGAGQSTEVQVTSTRKYEDDVLRDDNALKVIAASSEITTGSPVSLDSFTEGTYVIQDQRTNNPNILPENRYYTDLIVHTESFSGRDVITESSLDNAGLYEFIDNGNGTYAVKTGDNYLKTTDFTMDNSSADGLISSASWTANKSESAVKLVAGPDGTVGLYTKDVKDNSAMMASWGGGQFSMWANYASPAVSDGSALLLYPASVTTTLKVTGQAVGDYEVVFEDTVLRIHVVDPVRVPVMGSVTVNCSGVSESDEVKIPENLTDYITCTVTEGTVTFFNNNAAKLTVGDIHTGTVKVGKAAFSVSIGIDEEIDMAKDTTKNIAYKDGNAVASDGLLVTTTTKNQAVLVTDIADIQDGGEYLIAGMRVQTVAGSEEINWNPGSQNVHGLKKLAGTPVDNDTDSFALTGYDAARVRFEKVGENTYNLYNVSAGKYLTGSAYNLGLTARKSEASAMTVTARLDATYGAGLVSIGTGSYEIGDWGGRSSDGFTMISKGSAGTELKLFAAVDSIATITANQTGVSYATVGGKTYQVNVFGQTSAAAELNNTLYPTVSAAVKDAKAGDTIVLLNTNTTATETVEIPVGVNVQYGGGVFEDAYYQVKNGDVIVAKIPVQSENGKAVLFLPSSAPEVENLTAENLNLGDAALSIKDGQATAALKVGAVTLTKTFTVAKAGNISAIFISGLKEENDNTENADINWINASKSNVGVGGKLVKVAADGTLSVNSDVKKMKGRGNTSWSAAVDGNAATDKKPYNITLEKKATLIDGLDYKEKKWCLIANNYYDFSGVNNYMAYTMYQEIGGNSAMHVEPVDLYVNGEYRGIYLVTDKVEIGTNRVNVPESTYTTEKDAVESQAKVIVENYDTHFDTNADVKYWQGAKNGATVTAAAVDDALSAGVLAYAYASEQRQDQLNGGYVLEVSHQYTDEAGWFITNHGVMISFKEPRAPDAGAGAGCRDLCAAVRGCTVLCNRLQQPRQALQRVSGY